MFRAMSGDNEDEQKDEYKEWSEDENKNEYEDNDWYWDNTWARDCIAWEENIETNGEYFSCLVWASWSSELPL